MAACLGIPLYVVDYGSPRLLGSQKEWIRFDANSWDCRLSVLRVY